MELRVARRMTAHSGRRRAVAQAVVTLALSTVGCLVVGELVLRLLPTESGLATLPVNAANPILRYVPRRAFTHSRGWRLADVHRGRTNNVGWVSDIDYDSTARTPLLAVVGDSYVEAVMVPYRATVHGRLARAVAGTGRVYGFGVSGAPLSQYLAEAEYARDHFHPQALAVVIVGNDFDESLLKYKSSPGQHYFVDDGHGALSLRRVDYAPTLKGRLARRSALARYIMSNLHAAATLERLAAAPRGEPSAGIRYVGNAPAVVAPARLADSRRAVDAFVRELPARSGLAPDRIALVVDAIRSATYSAEGAREAEGSYFDVMRRYVMETAHAAGYEVIDLQPAFAAHYRREHRRFEASEDDAHWGALGHEVAAAELRRSRLFATAFADDAGPTALRAR